MTLLLAAHAQTFGANNGLQIGQRGIEVIIHNQIIIFGVMAHFCNSLRHTLCNDLFAVLTATAAFGFPVSTTHTISACVFGVGATKRLSAVRWGIAGKIVMAWVLTLPACIAMAWGIQLLLSHYHLG